MRKLFKQQPFYKEWVEEATPKVRGVDNFLERIPVGDYIEVAFVWGNTNRGYDYWEHMDNRWNTILKETA